MSIEITDSLKAQILLSAVTSAGPGATDDQVNAQISRLVDMLSDGSPQLRIFDHAAQKAENSTGIGHFVGTIVYVDLEGNGVDGKQPTNRPIVFIRTGVSKYYTDGIEHIRLDRIDSRDGERAKQLTRQAESLIGHKVLVTKRGEKVGGESQRVLVALEDRGLDAEFPAEFTLQQGAKMIDWTSRKTPDRVSIVPRLKRLPQLLNAS